MIQALLIRWGLTALAPYLVYALGAAALGTLGGLAWWFEATDLQTIVLIVVALGLLMQYSMTESKLGRLVLVAALGGVLYLKGTFDQQVRFQGELEDLANAHKRQVEKIHEAYKKATDAEVTRQARVIEDMRQAAALNQKDWEHERVEARARIKQLEKEAKDDADANRIAFGPDAVKRLNRLRHDPGRKRRSTRPKGGS